MKNLSFGLAEKFQADLVSKGLITENQLKTALTIKAKNNQPLGHILINEGYIPENKLLAYIGRHLNLNYVNVESYSIDPQVLNAIPVELAKKYTLIPLYKVESTLTIAVSDPINVQMLDEVKKAAKAELDLVLSNASKIAQAINLHYGQDDLLDERIGELETAEYASKNAGAKEQEDAKKQLLAKVAEEPGIIKMVNSIIWKAISDRASDIHLDPAKEDATIRFRIDGRLLEIKTISKKFYMPIVSRIKVIAEMDISQSRVPQDGSIRLSIAERNVELRIATYPTIHGEAVTIRILSKQSQISSLDNLGLLGDAYTGVGSVLQKKYGIFLVTGPTGSGKSTTLYTLLGMINSKEKHVISIEDPVEIALKGVNQAQINTKAGLTFAAALRSMLRHDPDVIMIGEIRDPETAELAVQAAVTGHLVVSSLHTNDAMSSIARLINLSVDPFLLSNALEGILNQRLVRVICPHCKIDYEATPEELEQLNVTSPKEPVQLAKGKGCAKCNMTGFLGRTGLFEWLKITDEIREFVLRLSSKGEHRGSPLLNSGGKTMRRDGFAKVLKGMTTIDEVLKATHEG